MSCFADGNNLSLTFLVLKSPLQPIMHISAFAIFDVCLISNCLIITTTFLHSELNYCNFIFLNTHIFFIFSKIHLLELSLTPKLHHTTHVLKSLHWLKPLNEFQCSLSNLWCSAIFSATCLHKLLSIQLFRSTNSSFYLIPARPLLTRKVL